MFKQDFKYYKSKFPTPDFSQILDFNNVASITDKVDKLKCITCTEEFNFGLRPVSEWQAYSIKSNPGLIFIRNPFTSVGQRYWVVRCVRDFTRKPNKLNLDAHDLIPHDQEWWDTCDEGEDTKLVSKLRWATLGYHHNWDTKEYSEHSKSDFPQDLQLLSEYVGAALGYRNFCAEAAIVNFYRMDSTLSGHTDHSEQFLEAPLFSFSFGQSAIFLIGGPTIHTKPTALYLHSGDIVVMSKQARLAYHGVPRILAAPRTVWNDRMDAKYNATNHFRIESRLFVECKSNDFWQVYDRYLNDSRININVRQVLRRGQKRLSERDNSEDEDEVN